MGRRQVVRGFNTHKVAVYGTLLHGHYNWERMIPELEPVAHDTVGGYYMRTNRSYPAVFQSDDENDRVHVQVFDLSRYGVHREQVMHRLDAMEFGAGYFRRLIKTDGGIYAWLYVMPSNYEDHFKHSVEDGDFDRHVKEAYDDYR